jgi:hypothetical protein
MPSAEELRYDCNALRLKTVAGNLAVDAPESAAGLLFMSGCTAANNVSGKVNHACLVLSFGSHWGRVGGNRSGTRARPR